jgi:DNA-binding PadR family transcriptional regulator
MAFGESLRIEGTLQGKILALLMEEPLAGSDLMRRLNIRSPGTMYPVLKLLREKGLIEYASERAPGKKLYVLSEAGVLELKKVLLGIGRGFYSRYLEALAADFVVTLQKLDPTLNSEGKVLSTLLYRPIKEWLANSDVTFLPLFEEIKGTYNLILCGGVATLIEHGWRTPEFEEYLSNLVSALEPEGTFVILEKEETDNIFVHLLFQEILGFSSVPGLSAEELRDILVKHDLQINTILPRRGVLLGIATKPQ